MSEPILEQDALRIAFHWHPETRVLVGTSAEPQSPEEPGVYYPPGADATFDAPPAVQERQAARRLLDNSAWEVVADWRGHVYWLPGGSRCEITELGISPPADALSEPPPPTAQQLWANARAWAAAELKRNDAVLVRCMKAGIAYPAAWQDYDAALRDMVRADEGDPAARPTRPDYPAGT